MLTITTERTCHIGGDIWRVALQFEFALT